MQNDYKRIFDEMLKQDLYVSPTAILQLLPQSGIAEKSEPTAMKLAPLWENTDLETPGNILVVPGPDAAPRLLVIHGGKAVVELDAGGKIVANHVLEIPEREYVTLLRTDVGADGRRYFVGTTPGLQQVHLFDDQWKLLWSFPPDAYEQPARRRGRRPDRRPQRGRRAGNRRRLPRTGRRQGRRAGRQNPLVEPLGGQRPRHGRRRPGCRQTAQALLRRTTRVRWP